MFFSSEFVSLSLTQLANEEKVREKEKKEEEEEKKEEGVAKCFLFYTLHDVIMKYLKNSITQEEQKHYNLQLVQE